MQGEQIAKPSEHATALLSRSSYAVYELKKENWQWIKTAAAELCPVIFVDGGQARLVATPEAELHRIRTATAAASGKGISSVAQRQGLLLIKLKANNGNDRFVCEANLSDSNLELEDGVLTFEAAEPAKAAEAVRRLAELHAAIKAVEGADEKGRFLVLDGTLETFSAKEKEAMVKLAKEAKERKVVVGAVAKTCSLLTEKGEALISAAEEASCGKEGYIMVAEGKSESHTAAIAVARLNKSAGHLFRIETASRDDLDSLISALKMQSNDLAFPGYPYGLVMADRFARVSNAEAELEKAKIIATADAEMKKMLWQEKAMNAHSILDRM